MAAPAALAEAPAPPAIDYADLLRRYVRHVLDCEGTDYTILMGTEPDPNGCWREAFTAEEQAAIQAIADEWGRE